MFYTSACRSRITAQIDCMYSIRRWRRGFKKTSKSRKFPTVQSGFRKQRSTTDQLVRLETFVREAFVNKQHTVAIFFDLEKAYDTTWKYGIMKDLFDTGLRGRLPIFIGNFLKDRQFQVPDESGNARGLSYT